MSPSVRRAEERVATNVLIVGAGGAGLRAAIELTEQGVHVLCTAKRPSRDAHTVLAQGGINAALGTMDPEDSWQAHAADTLKEGYSLDDPTSSRRSPARRRVGSRTSCAGARTSRATRTGRSCSASSAPTVPADVLHGRLHRAGDPRTLLRRARSCASPR